MLNRIGLLGCFGLVLWVGSLFLLSCGERMEEKGTGKEAVMPSLPKPNPGPNQELAACIQRGKALFYNNTLGQSGMSCNSCHMEGGTKDNPQEMMGMKIDAFDNLGARYPQYVPMVERVVTLSAMVDFCIVNALKGEPLAWYDDKLIDLTAYCASVKKAE
jgi:cytochrome c